MEFSLFQTVNNRICFSRLDLFAIWSVFHLAAIIAIQVPSLGTDQLFSRILVRQYGNCHGNVNRIFISKRSAFIHRSDTLLLSPKISKIFLL